MQAPGTGSPEGPLPFLIPSAPLSVQKHEQWGVGGGKCSDC